MTFSVWGVSMVKDEADVIGFTLLHMAASDIDGIVIANNNSTDNTLSEIDKIKRLVSVPIVVVDDPDPAYYQAEKMTRLATIAATHGADWIVPFDADEIWCSTGSDSLGDRIRSCAGYNVIPCDLRTHVVTESDPGGNVHPFMAMQHVKHQEISLPKVAFRWEAGANLQQGNHGVAFRGPTMTAGSGLIEARHFPVRSAFHFVRKARNGAAAYAETNLPAPMGSHWRAWGEMTDLELTQLFVDEYVGKPEDVYWNPARLAFMP